MKKCFYTLIAGLLITITSVNAQTEKGNVLVGGDIANFQLGLNNGGNFNIQLNPKAALFVQNNVAFGGYALLGITTAKHAGTSFNYGVGALGRYYFGSRAIQPVRNTHFFVESSVGIEGYNPAVGDNTNGLALGVGPGIAYFLTPNIGIEGLLLYKALVGFGSATATSNLNFNLGFQVYLPKGTAKRAVKNVTQ